MYELGQKLRIIYYPSWTNSGKDFLIETKDGQVVFTNKFYFTVQFENYKESFMYVDKKNTVEVLDGNKRTA